MCELQVHDIMSIFQGLNSGPFTPGPQIINSYCVFVTLAEWLISVNIIFSVKLKYQNLKICVLKKIQKIQNVLGIVCFFAITPVEMLQVMEAQM